MFVGGFGDDADNVSTDSESITVVSPQEAAIITVEKKIRKEMLFILGSRQIILLDARFCQ